MNIFGKNLGDYRLLRALDAENELDSYMHGHAQRMTRSAAAPVATDIWDSYGNYTHDQLRAGETAQAYGYLTDNLLAIQAEIDEVIYASYRSPEWVSINENIDPGAGAYGVRVLDSDGRAERIDSTTGTSAPSATTAQSLVSTPLYWYGLDASWTLDELRGAMLGNHPLETYSIEAAISGHLRVMDQVVLNGGGFQGATGLLNHPTASPTPSEDRAVTTAAGKAWSGATSTEIRKDISTQINAIIKSSQEAVGRVLTEGMTVFLPVDQYSLLTEVYVGNDARMTLMKAMMEDNPWTAFSGMPLNFTQVLELDDTMVLTLKHNRVAELGVPIMPRVVTTLDMGRQQIVQTESKFSELFVKRPNLIRYLTGI